jgi:hypothetical protein
MELKCGDYFTKMRESFDQRWLVATFMLLVA